ncbi:MAG: hypothetical protein K2L03_03620, partial [Bacteroidales bacterium]|nr:hypothetical protein [Bacteroidales bacterium]
MITKTGSGRFAKTDTTSSIENCQEVPETCAVTYAVVDASATGYTMQAQANCGAATASTFSTMSAQSRNVQSVASNAASMKATAMNATGTMNTGMASTMSTGTGKASTMNTALGKSALGMASTMSAMGSGAKMASTMSAGLAMASLDDDAAAETPAADEVTDNAETQNGRELLDKLYVVECLPTQMNVPYTEENEMTGELETKYRKVDTVICTLKVLGDIYQGYMERCDTVMDSIQNIRAYDSLVWREDEMSGDMVLVSETFYDTTYDRVYDIRCRQIDTIFTYDTVVSSFTAVMADTIASTDELRYGGLLSTDTVLEVCPRLMQT